MTLQAACLASRGPHLTYGEVGQRCVRRGDTQVQAGHDSPGSLEVSAGIYTETCTSHPLGIFSNIISHWP